MRRLQLSHRANEDIARIWQYIGGEKGNVETAERIIVSLRETFLLLIRYPQLGKPCREFGDIPRLRCINAEGYVVYYRETGESVLEIVRVVHTRQDHSHLVFTEPLPQ